MKRTLAVVAALSLALVVSCKKEETKTPPKAAAADAAPKAPPPAPPDAAPAPTEDGNGLVGKGNMGNCPAAVEKADVKIENTKDGVTVTVTATDKKDKATVDDIRARGKKLLDAAKKEAGEEAKHTGMGEGGGGSGHCPIVMKDTTVTSKDVDGGAAYMVKPNDAKQVQWLQTESAKRWETHKATMGAGAEKPAEKPADKPADKPAEGGDQKK